MNTENHAITERATERQTDRDFSIYKKQQQEQHEYCEACNNRQAGSQTARQPDRQTDRQTETSLFTKSSSKNSMTTEDHAITETSLFIKSSSKNNMNTENYATLFCIDGTVA